MAARPAKPGSRRRSAGMPAISKIGLQPRVLLHQRMDGVFEVGLGVEVEGHCDLKPSCPRERDQCHRRFPLCAEPERLSASRPCLFGAAELRSGARRPAAGCCCASRISTRPAAGRNSRPRSIEDLAWLGIAWEDAGAAAIRASCRLSRGARRSSSAQGLIYPGFESRAEIARLVAQREANAPWPRDPDGAPLYPGAAKSLSRRRARAAAANPARPTRCGSTWRRPARGPASSTWIEHGDGSRRRDAASWPPGRRPGATSSSRARRRRPAIISRWWSTTPCRG